MNKTLLAAGLSLAMAGSSAWAATGIQIDPTGSGSVGNGFVVNNLGSDFGDLLMQSLFNAANGNSGTVYMHNVFDLGTQDAGEVTFTMWMETEISPTTTDLGGGIILTDPNNLVVTNPTGFSSYFALFYDPLDGGLSSGLAANHDTGAGYDDGVKLASGRVFIDLDNTGGSNFTLTLTLSTPIAPLDDEVGSIPTYDIGGNIALNVEFDPLSLDTTGYLLNNLVTLDIDMEVNGGIFTPYDEVLASDVVGGTTDDDGLGDDVVGASSNAGTDGENDFTCSISGNQLPALSILGGLAVDQDCDAQAQITSVLDFNASTVPEPTTLGLLGAGLGLAGLLSRRRKSVA